MRLDSQETASPLVTLEAKVEFLKRPDAYNEGINRIGTVETHMSWVFLTEQRAYKLKKPVRYEFLDFSTVDARRQDCEEEVRLNRRLAPGVYIGTVALTVTRNGELELNGGGERVDWLVQMHRLRSNQMLDYAIRNHRVQVADVRSLALMLARFYSKSAPVPKDASEYIQRFKDDIQNNLEATRTHGISGLEELGRRVATAQFGLLEREPGLLAERAAEGKIIEAHGDLRPEHICLGHEPKIIDCLEFNREFRTLDPVEELAFLGMECEQLGAPSVGELVLDTYADITGDQPKRELLSFYKSSRAFLRAKLAIWHTREPAVHDVSEWTARAERYLQLSESYVHEFE